VYMKNYVCLFVALFIWCSLIPVLMPYKIEGQAVSDSVAETSEDINTEIQIRYQDTNESIKTMPLEEYVARALSVIMDENSPPEALKAQAVAVRSVVCYRYENVEHDGYELCSDPDHCFSVSGVLTTKATEASFATKGEVLTYNGNAVLALSHPSSCVSTESYETVYGKKLDYLTATRVYDESVFEDYKQVYKIDKSAFRKAFSDYNVVFSDDDEDWIGKTEFTGGNRVYTIEVGGLCFKGATVAKLLKLQSVCFNIESTDSGFNVSCYGIGNGVGMSRYTAVLMAMEGKNYRDILEYFYKDTLISHIKSE